jgi:L-aspartate oxidase
MQFKTDFLIIGSGIAGLSLAIKLAPLGQVTVVTKKTESDTATNLAQGGIACVFGPDDSFDLQQQDTQRAGDGLCHEDIVEMIISQGHDRIMELEDLGLEFNRESNNSDVLDLGKEGEHSRRRIVHVGDFTGRSVQRVLMDSVDRLPSVEVFEDYVAVDLITENMIKAYSSGSMEKERCLGAYLLEVAKGKIHTFMAPITVLATGGCGKVYLYTSNPDIATGDGIAIAYRAGVRIANLEFVQFHPTCLYHPKAKNFLISEALRGEGARLLDPEHRPFMEKYDPKLKELAGRDIVARAIDTELKNSGKDCVYLDISHRSSDFIRERFPNIHETCLSFGIDITKEPIPVVPAAHYMCGGVITDSHGETDLKGLFALGETACTGLHGANRLASNSLLEALVMAHQAFLKISEILPVLKKKSFPQVPQWETRGAVDLKEAVLISHNWDVIRRLMWNYVGIVRSTKRLELAKHRLSPILEEIRQHYWEYILTRDFIELRNLAQVAELIIIAASKRKESRGGHFTIDYPCKDDWNWRRDTIIQMSRKETRE